MTYAWNDERRAHLARTALANDPGKRGSRYHQQLWAAAEYAKEEPNCSSTAAYKELDRQGSWRNTQ